MHLEGVLFFRVMVSRPVEINTDYKPIQLVANQ